MKSFLPLMLLMILSFLGCSESGTQTDNPNDPNTTSQQQQQQQQPPAGVDLTPTDLSGTNLPPP